MIKLLICIVCMVFISSCTPKTVDEMVLYMTLEEKIYQMMFVTPESITGMGRVTAAGEKTKEALSEYPVGGIIYFANNVENREQTIQMIENTQKYSDIPLFIGVDEEGGSVARIGNNPNMKVPKLPPMKQIGLSENKEKAYEAGETIGEYLSELGFNVDFAPVADVLVNDNNTEIGDRAFGTDSIKVSEFVAEFVRGIEIKNVSSVLKHFPGHGSTVLNSHLGTSESERSIEQMKNEDFLPFKTGIEAGADFVMVSHITPVSVGDSPASLSKEIITDYLKGELEFSGIVITDSFSMGAITEHYTDEEAAVAAINAGADMLLMPENPENACKALLTAVEDGIIDINRINESVKKILKVKKEKRIIS